MKTSEAFNRILSSACPANVEQDDKGELLTFHIDLHCVEVLVKARAKRRKYQDTVTTEAELSEYLYTVFEVESLEFR